MANANLSIRVDKETKEKANELFNKFGLTMKHIRKWKGIELKEEWSVTETVMVIFIAKIKTEIMHTNKW